MPSIITDPSLSRTSGIINNGMSPAASIWTFPDAPAQSILNFQAVPTQPLPGGTESATGLISPPALLRHQLKNFSPEVYELAANGALVHFMQALLGDSGVGQLRKRQVVARLQENVTSSSFYDLDAFYGALFTNIRGPAGTLPTNPATGIAVSPYTDLATPDGWDQVEAIDAVFRERIVSLARAITLGATVPGLQALAEAITGYKCHVYEVWRIIDNQGPQPGVITSVPAYVQSYENYVTNDPPLPQAWWKLTSNFADSSGNGLTGTPTSVSFTSTSATTGPATAAFFNGTTSGVLIPYNPSGYGGLTVEAWVNLGGFSQSGNPRLIADSAFTQTGYQLLLNGGNQPAVTFGNGTTAVNVFAPGTISGTGWHYIAATWNAAVVSLYVDGQAAGNTPLTGTLGAGSAGQTSIGYNVTYNGDFLHGFIAEAAVFSRALTSTEIAAKYAAMTGGTSSQVSQSFIVTWYQMQAAYANWNSFPPGVTWNLLQGFSPTGSTPVTPQQLVTSNTPSYGGFGINCRNEVIIVPRRTYPSTPAGQTQWAADQYGIARVTEVLKPANVLLSVSNQSQLVSVPVPPAAIWSDSDYWEVMYKVSPVNLTDPAYAKSQAAYQKNGAPVTTPITVPAPPKCRKQGTKISHAKTVTTSWSTATSTPAPGVIIGPVVDAANFETEVINGQVIKYTAPKGVQDPVRATTARTSSAVGVQSAPYSGPRQKQISHS